MSARRLAAVDAPSPQGTLDRLHNSGWGGPPEQYRTPMLGKAGVLDLPLLLETWTEMPTPERTALQAAIRGTRSPRRRRPVPETMLAAVVARACRAVEQAHGGALRAAGVELGGDRDPSRQPDALRELAQLRDHVMALGWTAGIVLIAAPQEPLGEASCADYAPPARADDVALALVTASLLHGTMVLWSAEPALERLRTPELLALRWLRPAQAPAPVRRRWLPLLGLGTEP